MSRRAKDAESEFFPGYAEITEIGSGDLATVYRALEVATERYVALKLLNVRDRSARALESFEREAGLLGPVSSHPNIVTLFGSFRAADGRPVLVLELCQGAVADRLVDGRGLPVRDAVSIGIKIAGALETAHRAGILHRDVKPQNILVTEFGEPALADFGVAMLKSSTQVTAGLFDFTTLHAAPELLEGGQTSAATDVYELASTLYQLIAGRSAFRAHEGESPAAVILRILNDPVQPLIGGDVPPQLSKLLLRSMSKRRSDRPATATEFAAQLSAVEKAQGWPTTTCAVRDGELAAASQEELGQQDTSGSYYSPPLVVDAEHIAGQRVSSASAALSSGNGQSAFDAMAALGTVDPSSLEDKITLRSGATSLTIDDSRIVSRRWLSRTEISWPSVRSFEPRVDLVSGDGELVVHTDHGTVCLPATKGTAADVRYVQALLAAYRERAMTGR